MGAGSKKVRRQFRGQQAAMFDGPTPTKGLPKPKLVQRPEAPAPVPVQAFRSGEPLTWYVSAEVVDFYPTKGFARLVTKEGARIFINMKVIQRSFPRQGFMQGLVVDCKVTEQPDRKDLRGLELFPAGTMVK